MFLLMFRKYNKIFSGYNNIWGHKKFWRLRRDDSPHTTLNS